MTFRYFSRLVPISVDISTGTPTSIWHEPAYRCWVRVKYKMRKRKKIAQK